MNQADYPRAEEEASHIYDALDTKQLKNMGDPLLHLSIAHACKMQSKTEKAMKFAREATELYEHDPQPFMVLGELLERAMDHKEAERYCRKALLKSDSPDCKQPLSSHNTVFTLCCLSASLVRQDQLSEAEKFAIQATHVDSNSTLPLKQLSEVYYHQGRLDEALHIAERAAKIDPDDPDIKERIDAVQSAEKPTGQSSAPASSGDQVAASNAQPEANQNGQVEVANASSGATQVSVQKSPRIDKPGTPRKDQADTPDKDKEGCFVCCFDKEK
jgi:tetratricopeptide (TPR) repeat protein